MIVINVILHSNYCMVGKCGSGLNLPTNNSTDIY